MQEAALLRSYTSDLTVLSLRRRLETRAEERAELLSIGVEVVDEPVAELVDESEGMSVRLAQSGRLLRFDTIYTALGLRGRSELAVRLGAEQDEGGMLIVDDHQRTSVPGVYAVGDVVKGLTQIGVAMTPAAAPHGKRRRSRLTGDEGRCLAAEARSAPSSPEFTRHYTRPGWSRTGWSARPSARSTRRSSPATLQNGGWSASAPSGTWSPSRGLLLPLGQATRDGQSKRCPPCGRDCSAARGLYGPHLPRFFLQNSAWGNPSLYQLGPALATLRRLVDCERIGDGGPRLAANLTDLETGASMVVDSAAVRLRPEHLVASMRLLPDFPPVVLRGGFSANLPLHTVLDPPPETDVVCIAVDLLGEPGPPVFSVDGMIERSNDLLFANQTRSALATFEARYAARREGGSVLLLLIACNGEGERLSQKTWDYGRGSIEERWRAGYEACRASLDWLRELPMPAPGRLQVHRFVVPNALSG